MKIKYDPSVDAMYIKLDDSEIVSTKKLDNRTIIDFDKKGNVVGVELLFVKERNPDFLRKLQVENLAA